MKTTTTVVLAVTLVLSGCATQINTKNDTHYSLIDPKGVDMQRYSEDYKDCAELGNQTDVKKAGVTGSIAGGLAGALLGAAIGGKRTASFGASYGAAAYGSEADVRARNEQNSAFRACLVGRGYRLIR